MIGRFARTTFFAFLPALTAGGALGVPVFMCLAGAFSFAPSHLRRAVEKRPAALLPLAAFLALCVLSAAWSAAPSAELALKVAAIGVFGLFLAAGLIRDARLTVAGSIAAFVVLAVLLAIEALWALPLNRAAHPETEPFELLRNLSRAGSLSLALTWAAAASLAAYRGPVWTALGVAALAAGGFISLQFGQSANTLAFAVGLVGFLVAFAAPRLGLWVSMAGLAVWLVAAPFATPLLSGLIDPASLPFSWNARLEIWAAICERIPDRLWFGHGLDAARMVGPEVPVHPHSASLQIWFETGLAGTALALAFALFGARALARRVAGDRLAAAAATGTIASIGVIANLSFNLWAEWWFATMFIVAGAIGALITRPRLVER